jgi:hypothetical protein
MEVCPAFVVKGEIVFHPEELSVEEDPDGGKRKAWI